jgi:hypothetical protein
VRPKEYKNEPDDRDTDRAVSVVRGYLSPVDAYEAVVGRAPNRAVARNLEARHANVAALRAIGTAVVHTPGRFPDSLHSSVVHPDADPLAVQVVPWPADVSNRFDTCFV